MNVDPKQINNLIKIFCELDEEYRGKALMEMNGLFFEYMNEQDYKRNNIPVTQEAKRNFIADTKEFAELLSELSKTQKASIVMYMEHLSPGSFTEENELEIKINHRKITLREYNEKYLQMQMWEKQKKYIGNLEHMRKISFDLFFLILSY